MLGREGAIPEGTNPDNLNSTVSFASSNKERLLQVITVNTEADRQVPSAFQVPKLHTEASSSLTLAPSRLLVRPHLQCMTESKYLAAGSNDNKANI